MLRMPPFGLVAPDSVHAAVEALAAPNARLVAGGTDLLPNLKHHVERPDLLVSLHRIPGLADVVLDEDAGELVVGTGITLTRLASDPRVRELFASLAEAAGLVAGPQIRNTATLGGNLHVDTRCRWVNQTEFWRGAIGGCLKADGDTCHVVVGGKRCVAALSSDCVPVLVSLDATLVLVGAEGERRVPLADYYHADGVRHVSRRDDELATAVRIPLPTGPRRTTYVKWRPRGAIDFPLVSVALRFDLTEEGADATIDAARAVAGVLAARPREVRFPAELSGMRFDDPRTPTIIADAVHEQCKPMANVPYDPSYRRHLSRVLTRRAVEALVADASGDRQEDET